MTGIFLDRANNNQFKVQSGDFLIDDTDLQEQTEIIYANKGNYLESPTLGVGILNYSSSPVDRVTLEKNIRLEFTKDLINTIQVQVSQVDDNNFKINVVAQRNG
jgi:hypothetical protein